MKKERTEITSVDRDGIKQVYFIFENKPTFIFENAEIYEGIKEIREDDLNPKIQKTFVLRSYGCPSSIVKKLQTQFEIIQKLRKDENLQPQFLKFHHYFSSNGEISFYLFMEHFEGAKLFKSKVFDEMQTLTVIKKITTALDYLEKKQFRISNFSPANILVNEKLEIKIFDFGIISGISKIFQKFFNELPMYSAPEIFTSQNFEQKSYSWTIGVTLYEMLYQKLPFSTKPIKNKKKIFLKEIQTIGQKIQKFGISEIQIKVSIKDIWKSLFRHTLTTKDRRWTCSQILEQLNRIREIDFVFELQNDSAQTGIKGLFQDLKFQLKRGELCFMYHNFLALPERSDIPLQKIFDEKVRLFFVYLKHQQIEKNRIEEIDNYFEKEHKENIDKLKDEVKFLESEEKETNEMEEEIEFSIYLPEEDKSTVEGKKKQIEELKTYEIKIKTLQNQRKMRLELILKSIQTIAPQILKVIDFSGDNLEENQFRNFLYDLHYFNKIDEKYIEYWLEIERKAERQQIERQQRVEEKKIRICFESLLSIFTSKEKAQKMGKKNYERLKLNMQILKFSENLKTMNFLEKGFKTYFVEKKKKEAQNQNHGKHIFQEQTNFVEDSRKLVKILS